MASLTVGRAVVTLEPPNKAKERPRAPPYQGSSTPHQFAFLEIISGWLEGWRQVQVTSPAGSDEKVATAAEFDRLDARGYTAFAIVTDGPAGNRDKRRISLQVEYFHARPQPAHFGRIILSRGKPGWDHDKLSRFICNPSIMALAVAQPLHDRAWRSSCPCERGRARISSSARRRR